MSGIQCQFDVDLSDVSSMSRHNDGIKFLLIAIVFSRFLWVFPLKSKTGKEVMHAFEIILKHKTPKCIRSDKGTEFTNRLVQNHFKDHGVHQFVTDNEPKANYAERVIRTLKGGMVRYFTHNQTLRYVDVLPQLVDSYNNTIHSSIGIAPAQVNAANERSVSGINICQSQNRPGQNKATR